MTHNLIIPEQLRVTPEQFTQIAQANRDLRLEQTATGELIVMPPTGGNTGQRNALFIARFVFWNEETRLGRVFDSSTAFRLPNGAARSPDVSWIQRERWETLTPDQQDTFPPLCPDFVLELRSKTDSLKELQGKMQEYLDNGSRLGWLINIQGQTVEIYRPGQEVEKLIQPESLEGETVLPGFTLSLGNLWNE